MELIAEQARHPSLEGAVDAVRELLGMDVAYVTRMTDTEQVFEVFSGDGERHGLRVGTRLPLEATYCRRVLDGELPGLMPDLADFPVAMAMPVTHAAEVAAFCTVPVLLADGTLHGTLCCGNHTARPELTERDVEFMHVLARIVAGEVERDLLRERHQAELLQSASVEALLAAVEARDGYTGEHSRNVVHRAVAVGRELGLTPSELRDVEHAALLHDVGKIGVPDHILRKPGPLTVEEWDVMREHPATGARIVGALPGLQHLAPVVRAEHERWDGRGYPDGLRGEEIPLAARIVFVCDAYDAMTTDRPYRKALGHEKAVAELRAEAGAQFCARCVGALLRVLEPAQAVAA